MQKTIYYPEGLPVRTGDIVWNNEGVNVRKVISIVTEEEAKQVFVADGVTDGAGFFWSRSIGESDLGILGFESKESFEEEGVGKLSRPELLCVKFLFHLLGKQIGLNIWNNKDYLYYQSFYFLRYKVLILCQFDKMFHYLFQLTFLVYYPILVLPFIYHSFSQFILT